MVFMTFKNLIFASCLSLLFFSKANAQFKIIERVQWGAEESTNDSNVEVDPEDYTKITLHFVRSEYFFHDCEISNVANYQKNLIRTEKLVDVPFQFMVDSCGQIYEGRPQHLLPEHAGTTTAYLLDPTNIHLNPNYGNIGIGIMEGKIQKISVEQAGSTVWLIEQLRLQLPIQSLYQIESLKKSITACGDSYVAPPILTTALRPQQQESFEGISNFFVDTLSINRINCVQ